MAIAAGTLGQTGGPVCTIAVGAVPAPFDGVTAAVIALESRDEHFGTTVELVPDVRTGLPYGDLPDQQHLTWWAVDDLQAALAYLRMIDSDAFEIAFTTVAQTPDDPDQPEDEEPIPLCATCGAPAGIFPEVILNWRHFRGATTAPGIHETYDPGHALEVAWYLPDETAGEF